MTVRELAVAADVQTTTPASVVVVGPLPPPQHGGTVATQLVLQTAARSFCVRHVDTSDARGLANIGRFDVANVRFAIGHVLRLVHALITERPALVYIPLAQNTLGALRDLCLIGPALLLRRRVVVHLHGGEFRAFRDRSGRLLRIAIDAALRRVQRVIVLAEPLADALAGMVPAERVAVLANGIRDPFDAVPDRSRRANAFVRVLFIGNVSRAKGIIELLDAVRVLHERGCAIHLDVGGDFASAEERRVALNAARGLEGVVRLHGFVDEEQKRVLLEAADIFAFPSHSEGHPYVVLEAMAAGLPVVATALPGLAGTVIDGETGLLVPVRSRGELTRAIAELATDSVKRINLGAAARTRFECHFSLARWSTGLTAILNGVLEAA